LFVGSSSCSVKSSFLFILRVRRSIRLENENDGGSSISNASHHFYRLAPFDISCSRSFHPNSFPFFFQFTAHIF
jgi:hypothetical protein